MFWNLLATDITDDNLKSEILKIGKLMRHNCL